MKHNVLLLIVAALLPVSLQARSSCGNSFMPSDTNGFSVYDASETAYWLQDGRPFIDDPWHPDKILVSDTTIGRVVGRGTGVEFNSDGTLKFWREYVDNHILSPEAELWVEPFITEQSPIVMSGRLFVNQHFEKDMVIEAPGGGVRPGAGGFMPQYQIDTCIKISTRHLKFPALAPEGQLPEPVFNEIRFFADSAICRAYDGSLHDCSPPPGSDASDALDVYGIKFEAMAPIVLMHGIRSTESAFSDFTTADKFAHLPFVGAIYDQSEILGSQKVSKAIMDAAKRFGARHAHLVAHSKGGLWARAFLTNPTANFGVYSLTTIDTPHHGSPLADLKVTLINSKYNTADNAGVFPSSPIRSLIGALYNSSMDELQTKKMGAYNAKPSNKLPEMAEAFGVSNKVRYQSISSDVNTDHSTDGAGLGTITCGVDDCSKMPLSGLGNFRDGVFTYMYQTVQGFDWIELYTGPAGLSFTQAQRATSWVGNDLLVSTTSAQYDGFQHLRQFDHNHSSILGPTVGNFVAGQHTSLGFQD